MTTPEAAPAVPRPAGPLANPYLLLSITAIIWGSNVVAGKLAVGHIGTYPLIVLRWAGAIVFALPLAIRVLPKDLPVILRHWWLYLCYGAIGFTSFNVLIYIAAYFTSGVNSALEQAAINLCVLAINFALFRVRVGALQLLGVAMTIAGIATIAAHGDMLGLASLAFNLGDLLVLGASFAYAAYSVALRWRPPTSWQGFLIATSIGAILGAFGYQALFDGGPAHFAAEVAATDTEGWLIALYTMVFPSLISQVCYVRGVQLIGANRASLFINLVPLTGAAASIAVLGERLEPFHLVAALLIAAGICVAEWSARRPV